jgi:hypothetical protein
LPRELITRHREFEVPGAIADVKNRFLDLLKTNSEEKFFLATARRSAVNSKLEVADLVPTPVGVELQKVHAFLFQKIGAISSR